MLGLILLIHVIVSILLIITILMQSGRGGGLTETFSGMESIFGTKTNVFLVRATTILAILFLITTLSLAYMSKIRGKSLMPEQSQPVKKAVEPTKTATIPEAKPQAGQKAVETPQEMTEAETPAAEMPTAKTVAPQEEGTTEDIEKTEGPVNQQ